MNRKLIGIVLGFFIFNLPPPFVYKIINGEGMYEYLSSHIHYNTLFFNVIIMAPYFISFAVSAALGGIAGQFFLKDRSYYLLAILCMITASTTFLFAHFKKDPSGLEFLLLNSLLILLVFWVVKRLAPQPVQE